MNQPSAIPLLKLFLLSIVLILLSGITSGCLVSKVGESDHPVPIADLAEMPADVQSAPVAVQQAYQFAVANPEVLQELPCYCGCGAMGHTRTMPVTSPA
jgi:hypothetical protein